MNKIALGLAALLTLSFAGTAVAQTVTPVEDNDVTVSDNVVVVINCIQNQVVTNTQTVTVTGPAAETPEAAADAPAVEVVQDQFVEQSCGNITVVIDSQVIESVTPTVTPTRVPVTPTVAPTSTVTATPAPREVRTAADVVVPQEAPQTGRAGL